VHGKHAKMFFPHTLYKTPPIRNLLCGRFIQDTIYRILSESAEFCKQRRFFVYSVRSTAFHNTDVNGDARSVRNSEGSGVLPSSQVVTLRLHVMQRTVLRRPFCLSVRLSVCLSNAWIATKRKKLLPTFLYHARTFI